MASNIIREYLVSLGFQIDKKSWDTWKKGLRGAAEDVSTVGKAATATAAAIALMVDEVARQYETLSYVSQRTNVPVARLKALEFASRQVGVSADEARAATESFYATLRTSPGARGLLQTMGGTEAGGVAGLVDTLKKRFGEGGYFIAQQFAQTFGIGEQTFRMYWMNLEKFKKEEAETLALHQRFGIASQGLAHEFAEYGHQVNRLERAYDALKTRTASDFLPQSNRILTIFTGLVEKAGELDHASGGLGGTLTFLATSALGLHLIKNLTIVQKLMPGVARAAGVMSAALTRALGPLALALWGWGIVERAAETPEGKKYKATGDITTDLPNFFRSLKPTLREAFGIEGGDERPSGGGGASVRQRGGRSRGDRNNNPGNIEFGPFAIAHGATGSDGRFAIFPTPEAGRAAMDALLGGSGYRGLSLEQIQRKWVGYGHGEYLSGMMKATGLGASGVPDLQDPDVRAKLMRAMSLGEGTHLTGEAGADSGKVVHNHVNTSINVEGNLDARAGRDVLDSQYDTYAKAYSVLEPAHR